MTKQKILEKALLKAHKNGWTPFTNIPWTNVKIESWEGNSMVGIAFLYQDKGSAVHWVRELEGIIFNADFAKALWGGTTEFIHTTNMISVGKDIPANGWLYHLQQMVILPTADLRIKYLGEHI